MSEPPPPGAPARDLRRLTGPSLLLDGSGAAMEATGVAAARGSAGRGAGGLKAGRDPGGDRLAATALLAARPFPGGASLAIGRAAWTGSTAATLVNEWACEAADSGARAADAQPPLDSGGGCHPARIAYERDPALLALGGRRARQSVAFVAGDRKVSVGLGAGAPRLAL